MALDSAGTFSRLQWTCKLLVLLCLLHISVTVVFYIRSLDNPFAFAQNQQARNSSAPTERLLEVVTSTTKPPEKKQPPQQELEKCPDTSPLLGERHFCSTHTQQTHAVRAVSVQSFVITMT